MRVAVLVSGGVDSTLALARLAATGEHELTAFYLKIWLEDELAQLGGQCPWDEDLRYVRAVCEPLGVPVEVVPLQRAYHERVVQRAIDELEAGRTPSPDVYCNLEIKFGAFFDAVGDGFDRVASGHYAQVVRRDGMSHLYCAPDPVKDQTYFLSRLRQDQVARLLFPIGDLAKQEVRARAAALGLATRDRPDSQGICFLGRIPYPEFVRSYLGDRPGDIVDIDSGRVLGRHRGLWFHTIGQRKGLGLGGGPWFVVDKELETRRLLVAHADRVAPWRRSGFEVERVHWIASPPRPGEALTAKLRHGPARTPCALAPAADGRLAVTLERPDQGVAPGQVAVFYRGDECLGSGLIA
ncbi:MAG: tRNA 2-thiouridine(34) synthase MnmA [Deltaproteobacteria bacterium]|nr:MAG: tRNA 2-thiouridine(34) synthase MnmA [Deltaproteobacteria bacterium]